MNKIIHVTFILLSLYYVQVECQNADQIIDNIIDSFKLPCEKDVKGTIIKCIKEKADVDISKEIKDDKEFCCVVWVGRDCFSSHPGEKCTADDKKSMETALDAWVAVVEGPKSRCTDHKYKKGMSTCGTCALISNTIFIVCLIIFGIYSQK